MCPALVDQPVFHSYRRLAIIERVVSETYPPNTKRVDLALTMMQFLIDSQNPHTCGISLGDIVECCYSYPPSGYTELHNERLHKYINANSWTDRDKEVFKQLTELGTQSGVMSIMVLSAVEAIKQAGDISPKQLPELRIKFAPIFREAGLQY